MRSDWQRPHPDRLDPDHPLLPEILERHESAMLRGEPTYQDPLSGFQVLTAAFLAARDRCCNSGCRHCPYVE